MSRAPILEDKARGEVVVYPTDSSWSTSDALAAAVEQEIRDAWLGVGCRIRSGRVVNRVVRVEATVVLRDASLLVDPSAITLKLREAARGYFEREDGWYMWRASALRALFARADRRIITCAAVRVLDGAGVALAEPAPPSPGDDIVHWLFADSALDVAYVGPA